MDSKKAIGGRLREARERLGISLQDIASSTRINAKFLAAIEEGGAPDVPTTYLRAFIKAFAEQVGLDPQEILKEYFTVEAPPPPPPAEANPERPRVHVSEPEPPKPPPKTVQSTAQRQVRVLVVITLAMIVALALLMMFLRDSRPDRVAQETPFSEIVREKESPPPPQGTIAPETAATKKVLPKPAVADSLRLEAVASESVWVHIVIDNAVTREYVLTPKRRLQWKGKSSFLISVGNASALTLILNGVKLAPIGAPSKPAVNVLLTRESIKPAVTAPAKKDNG